MSKNTNEFEKMVAGKLYNAASKDLEKPHTRGMVLCDMFNRTPLWLYMRKQRLLKKLLRIR